MRVYKIIIFLVVFLSSFITQAADVNWSVRIEGADVIPHNPISIEDGDFADLNIQQFTDLNAFGYVRFGFEERLSMDYIGDNEFTVNLKITTYNNSGQSPTTVLSSLVIQYSGTGNGITFDASDYRMPGVYKFDVEIESILDQSGAIVNIPDFIYLEAGIRAERYYKFNEFDVAGISSQWVKYDEISEEYILATGSSDAEEIYLNWDYIHGAEYYDLEWTWVDNYAETGLTSLRAPSSISLMDFEFRNNCTRIRTTDQYYRIPQIFSNGYLIFRVRGVGRWQDDLDKDLLGKWSSDNGVLKENVGNYPNFIIINGVHEAKKNWQYQSTYAEDGKKKEVTQYFDGSLRGRQTVTRINSDNQSVVGETIYDTEGRGVIQILPVPQDNPSIKFYEAINVDATGKPYSHLNFNWENSGIATCSPESSDELNSISGAAHYYSANGFDALTDGDWQQYVPESNGYPYTQVEYTPDNTGRIRNQSGVGEHHKIGSNHETKYYYTQPTQEELNRLFGYKVGYKRHYKKNMVVDANGQVSISYLDAQGRVIATAMSGDSPDMFDALESHDATSNHNIVKSDLLNNGNPYEAIEDDWIEDDSQDDNIPFSTGVFGAVNDGLKIETQIPVTTDGTNYDVLYDVIPTSFEDSCNSMVYPYVYDLTLSMQSDCADELLLDDNNDPFQNELIGDLLINPTGYTYDFSPINETVILNQGSYTMYKSLTVNENALNEYLEFYLNPDQNQCLLDTFVYAVDLDCYFDCDSCDVFEDEGANVYMVNLAIDQGIDGANANGAPSDYFTTEQISVYNQQFLAIVEDCHQRCAQRNSCDSYYSLLVGDMSPYGQYGNVTGQGDLLNVYVQNGSSTLPNPGFWYDGSLNYLDEFGNQALVDAYPIANSNFYQITPNGQPVEEVEPWELDRSSFVTAFEPSWADALIQFHPEYPLYEYSVELCSDTAIIGNKYFTSEEFDRALRQDILTYDQAVNNVGSENIFDFNMLGTTNLLIDIDPYFNINYPSHIALSNDVSSPNSNYIFNLKLNLISESLTNYKGNGMSMEKFAIKMALYGNDLTVTVPSETLNTLTNIDDKNAVWEAYKSLYLSLKAEINQLIMDSYGFSLSPQIYNGCIGDGALTMGIAPVFQYSMHFPDITNMAFGTFTSGSGWPSTLCGSEYTNKEIRITRVDALYNPSQTPQQVIDANTAAVEFTVYEETGLCPLVFDLEAFLNAMTADVDATGMITSPSIFTQLGLTQADIIELSPDLNGALVGSSSSNTAINGVPGTLSGGGNGLIISLGTGSTQLEISDLENNPTGLALVTLPWSSYSSSGSTGSWDIFEISHTYPTGGVNDEAKILILAGPNYASAQEYIATYTIHNAQVTFNNCPDVYNSQNDPECKEDEIFEGALLSLIQYEHLQGNLNTSTFLTGVTEFENTVLAEHLSYTSSSVNQVEWDRIDLEVMKVSHGGSSYSLSFSTGTTFPSTQFIFQDLDIDFANYQPSLGYPFTINSIDDQFTITIYSGFFVYENNNITPYPLKVDCGCNTNPISELIADVTNNTLQASDETDANFLVSISNVFYQLDDLGIQDVVINNWVSTDSFIEFEVYDLSDCKDVNDDECVGDPCVFRIEFPDGKPTTSNNGGDFQYIENGTFETIYSGEVRVTINISCFDFPPCDDNLCDPSASLVEPVSCTDAYNDYQVEMTSIFGFPFDNQTIFPITPDTQEDIFYNEYYISDTVFCASSLAYITEAYKHYNSTAGFDITSPSDPHFLTISEFGNTALGYSNSLLISAINAYNLSNHSNINGTTYLEWTDYVSLIYMASDPTICPAMMPDVHFTAPAPDSLVPCNMWSINVANVNAQNQYNIYTQQMKDAFTQAYVEGAISSVKERLEESHMDKEYHYTLYYYDRAGNLIQTVPPKRCATLG